MKTKNDKLQMGKPFCVEVVLVLRVINASATMDFRTHGQDNARGPPLGQIVRNLQVNLVYLLQLHILETTARSVLPGATMFQVFQAIQGSTSTLLLRETPPLAQATGSVCAQMAFRQVRTFFVLKVKTIRHPIVLGDELR